MKQVNVGDIVSFGSWPAQLEGPFVSLSWRVLEVRANGDALLLCRDIIECRSFHDSKGDITWQTCDLRYWLNAVFFTHAFSSEEQALVIPETCAAEDNAVFRTEGGGDTEDFVFCLGFEQVKRFFSADAMRQAHPTAYAMRAPFTCWWWLRAPGGHQFSCAAVAENGAIDYNGFHASLDCIGVRPAVVVSGIAIAGVAAGGGVGAAAALGTGHDASGVAAAGAASHAGAADGTLIGNVAAAGDAGSSGATPNSPCDQAFLPDAPLLPHAGAALRYGLADQAAHLLQREHLRAETAQVALSGGEPSISAVLHLLDQGELSNADIFHLCNAAIRLSAVNAAARLADALPFDADRFRRLLKTAVEKGNANFTQLLLDKGASGKGFGAAYLKMGVRDDVARCALIADPPAVFDCWDVLQTLPYAACFAVGQCKERGQLAAAARLPHVLTVLAQTNALDELDALLSIDQTAPIFARDDYAQALDTAKRAGFGSAVALLLDRQAARFHEPRVGARPNLAL